MTGLGRDDLRAAVAAGMVSEAQAASLLALAQERAGVRRHLAGLDEPFELLKGFNEIFIVVGLAILFAGWLGVTGLSVLSIQSGYVLGMIYPAVAMGVLIALARYFTLHRRMVAPSIALSVMFGLSAGQFGTALAAAFDANFQGTLTTAAAIAGILLALYYWLFRVPFTVALIAASVFATAFGLVAVGGRLPESPEEIFLLSADGPFAILTIVLGLIGLVVAMVFDMSDPHRVTRRSASGFWLHIIAAPVIVNTIALTLFQTGTTGPQVMLVTFLAFMALFAVVIDRRSFLVSAVGYVVALAITVIEGNAFFVILLLGAGLVLLGAQWEWMRRAILRALPNFPGKGHLPPWDVIQTEEQSS